MIIHKIMTYDDVKPGPRGPGLQKTVEVMTWTQFHHVEVMILGPGFIVLK